MDSLSELLKKMPFAAAMNEQAAAKSQQIVVDPLIVKWRKKHPFVNDHDLKLHMNRFYQYVVEFNNCNQCPGLALCPNDYPGHYSKLTADHDAQGTTAIYDQKVSCKKYIAKQTQDAIRSRIHSFYVDDRALSEGY